MQRRYLTENIINCRDLGGYPCRNGVTAFGRALRCGIPQNPTEKDIEILKKIGIKTIIDLRGNIEAKERPSYFTNRSDFDYHHITLLETNPALVKKSVDIVELYKKCLNEYKENFAAVLRIISNLNEPFLFHCFLGKDRTGLLAALLLSAAGVAKEDIIADYQVTYTYIIDFYRREAASGSGLIWESDENNLRSLPEFMNGVLTCIEDEFGGVDGYFRYIGLSENEIKKLGEVLL